MLGVRSREAPLGFKVASDEFVYSAVDASARLLSPGQQFGCPVSRMVRKTRENVGEPSRSLFLSRILNN
jgi:hypothetical protein